MLGRKNARNGLLALFVSEIWLIHRPPSRFALIPSIDGAGVDTTQAILRRFVFAMIAQPHMQRRAQEELDSVTGGGRLPTLEE